MPDDKRIPYVGPQPFRRGDESLFFGRDQERKELLSLVIAHQAVLLYAQSGAGKTSLLNAGLLPLLESRSSQVFGGVRVSGELPKGIELDQVRNIYVFNALLTLSSSAADRLLSVNFRDYLQEVPFIQTPEGTGGIRVVIFDQFEEIFVAYPERWRDRAQFFEQIGDALETDPRLRVVFSMREEHIASMDPFAPSLPERLRTRFRLERLRESAALLAVTRPLQGTGRSFVPGAAEKLVANLLQVPARTAAGTRDLSGEFVEPVQLQVVCRDLWESLPPDVTEIDDSYIRDYGDVDRALSRYYESCLRRVSETSRVKEGTLRRWFEEYLITADHTRGTVYKDLRTSGGLANESVQQLEDLHLVRVEVRGGAPWYELTHDRFIHPILESNERWRSTIAGGRLEAQRLEARAKNWHEEGRPEGKLLSEGELKEAQRWLDDPAAEDLGISKELRSLVATSENVREQRHTRSLRLQRSLGLILLILVTFVAVYTFYAKKHVEDSTFRERGRIAKQLASIPGRGLDAVALGVAAVASRIKAGGQPPSEAIEGLRAAVTKIGYSRQVGNGEDKITDFSMTADKSLLAQLSASKVNIWDMKRHLIIRTLTFRDDYDPTGLMPLGRGNKIAVFRKSVTADTTREKFTSITEAPPTRSEIMDIWSVATGRLEKSVALANSQTYIINQTGIMAQAISDNIVITDLINGNKFLIPASGIKNFDFSDDDKLLLASSQTELKVINLRGEERKVKISTPSAPEQSTISHSREFIAISGGGKKPWVLLASLKTKSIIFLDIDNRIESLWFSSDDQHLVACASKIFLREKEILVFNTKTGKLTNHYAASRAFHSSGITDTAIEIHAQAGRDSIRIFNSVTNTNLINPIEFEVEIKMASLEEPRLLTLDENGIMRRTELHRQTPVFTRLSPAQLLAIGCWQLWNRSPTMVSEDSCRDVASPKFLQQ